MTPHERATTAPLARTIVRRLVPAILAAALLLATGCAVRPAVNLGPAASLPPDVQFVIPPGTAAAHMRGEPAFTVPSELTLLSGQTVVIRNEDQAMHYFAEAPIAPGQTYRKTFGRAGAFGYGAVLSCSVAERESVTITVVDRLPDGVTAAPR